MLVASENILKMLSANGQFDMEQDWKDVLVDVVKDGKLMEKNHQNIIFDF